MMMIRCATWIAAPLLLAALPAIAAAQPRVAVDPIACLPTEQHAVVTARVANEPGGSTVRLYFRRLHQEVEDFYYVEMDPRGGGQYWAALPKPADEELDEKRLGRTENDEEHENAWAAWWFAKERSDHRDPNDDLNETIIEERASLGRQEGRDWMLALTLEELETLLEELENEPAELFATIVSPDGRELARSPMTSTLVRDDCQVSLTREERGQASNLVIGETAPWQAGRKVFHWLCDGIVSRIDPEGVLRVDDTCRACVVALVRPELLLPASASVIGITIIEPVSRVEP
jgi:hypothetical protein